MESKYPWWVRVSVWGCSTRLTVRLFAIFCALLFAISVFYIIYSYQIKSTVDVTAVQMGAAAFMAFLAYHLSINWIDNNGDWNNISTNWAGWKDHLKAIFVGALFYYIVLHEAIPGCIDGFMSR